MAKFVPLMIALLMIGVFSLSLLMGGIMFQSQNYTPANNSITNDPSLAAFNASMTDALQNSSTSTASADQAFTNSSVTTTGVTPYISAVGGIWKVLKAAPLSVYNLIVNFVFAKIVGSTAALVLVSVFSTIMILIIISAVIYWVSRGEGG